MKFFKYILIVSIVVLSACKSKYPALEDGLYADIQTNRGDVLIKLHHKEVPLTVANFVALAEGDHPKLVDSLQGKPFYNKIKFHRVIPDFMVQAGDPTGTGKHGAGFNFQDEFPLDQNGKLIYKHDSAGVLSMANSGPATNSSQFFITHKATPWLDGKHSVFGKVQLGQNVIDTIAKNDYINVVDIIRVGSDAKSFNAPNVFTAELEKASEEAKQRKLEAEKARKKLVESFELGKAKSIKTPSGLQYLNLQKGTGKKVNPAIPTQVHYTLYLANGKKIESTKDKNRPFTFIIDKMGLIAGWKEGMKLMREGDVTRLFIPSYLGYADRGVGPIPANSDLVFDIEVLKVGK